MFSPVGLNTSRCTVCGATGGSSNSFNSYRAANPRTSYSPVPSYPQLGVDGPIISAQTDKIIQLRHELRTQSPNNGYNFSQANYFPPGNLIKECLCDEYPKVLNKPTNEKTFELDRYVPYDHIHADLEACSIRPKPRANVPTSRRVQGSGCTSNSDKVKSAVSHLDAAKRILSSA